MFGGVRLLVSLHFLFASSKLLKFFGAYVSASSRIV
jgi:hypothetical protein